jgi:hypothetical protein
MSVKACEFIVRAHPIDSGGSSDEAPFVEVFLLGLNDIPSERPGIDNWAAGQEG